jgi:hypothetical protein
MSERAESLAWAAADRTRDPAVPQSLRTRWLIANGLAFVVGAVLWGGALRAIESPYYETMMPAVRAGLIQAVGGAVGGAAFGTVVAAAQWLVLRRTLRMTWWIPASVAGWTISMALSAFVSGGSVSTIGPAEGPLSWPVAMLVRALGLVSFGLFPWLVLRRQVAGAALWPVGNVAAILLSLGAGLAVATSLFVQGIPLLTPEEFPSAKALLIVGSIGAPIYATVTWMVLGMLKRPSISSDAPTAISG